MQKLRFLIIVFIFVSCSKRQNLNSDMFLSVTLSSEVNVSIKTIFNDTIFVEKKYANSVEYSYATLSKKETDHFANLIFNLKKQTSKTNFELSEGGQVFIIASNKAKLIFQQDSLNKSSVQDINKFFSKLSFTKTSAIKNFWNINGIVEVPFPPKKIDESIFSSNGL